MKTKLSKSWTILSAISLLGATATSSRASDDEHVHKTLKNGNHTAEVQVDHSKVTVRLSRDAETNPRSVLLTFYDSNNKPTTFELKSLSPLNQDETGVSTYSGDLNDGHAPAEAEGTLSPSHQSYIGMELRIPLSKGEPEILRVKPVE